MRQIKWAIDGVLLFYLFFLLLFSVPTVLGFQIFGVISASMSPEIPTGSAVYVRKAKFAELKEGDIITFVLKSGLNVTHRIKEKQEETQSFITKGDANEEADASAVPIENVKGAVRFHLPYLGYAAALLNSPGEKIVLAGIWIWLCLIEFIVRNLMDLRQERRAV